MLASTELINFYSMSDNNMRTFVALLKEQGITRFIVRLNAFSEWSSGTSGGIDDAIRMVEIVNTEGIEVCVDLHTWYTTWDNYFRDGVTNYVQNRANYIQFVRNVLSAFQSVNVYAFMVLNEPQARSASGSENQFILDIITAAHETTSKPVSVRFMGGYSPSTGHYDEAIDVATDFLCRNSFWDARNPSASVYGMTEAKFLTAIARAHDLGKEFWITEFGAHKDNPENQRSYVAALVAWARQNGVDAAYCWVSQPTSNSEDYNIFSGYTPFPAFYELINEEVIPECSLANDCVDLYGEPEAGKVWTCVDGVCILQDIVPEEYWYLDIHKSGEGSTQPTTGIGYPYPVGQDAVVTAYPASGWHLVRWELDGVDEGSANPYTIPSQAVNVALHLMAIFEADAPPIQYALEIRITEGGVTVPTPGIRNYDIGTIVTVTAKEDEGYTFKHFELDGEIKMQNPINVGMNADRILLAVFEVTGPPISLPLALLFLFGIPAGIGVVVTAKSKGEYTEKGER